MSFCNEFGVDLDECALSHVSCYGHLMDDTNSDNIIDDLSDMTSVEFKNTYPNICQLYYIEKIIESERIIVMYNYPLDIPRNKIYVSSEGFSIYDVAVLIKKEFNKMYAERDIALKNNKTPKYLDRDVLSIDNLCPRFSVDYAALGLTSYESHKKHSLVDVTTPIVSVSVDT